MNIRLWCNSGANIHSNREVVLTVEEFGFTEDEWGAMSDEEKFKEVEFWAYESGLDIGWNEE